MSAVFCLIFCLSWLVQIQAGAHGGFGNTHSVQEGFCAPHYPAANVYKDFHNDLQPEGGFYLAYGSQYDRLLLAQEILGRPPTSSDHLSDFCPRLDFQTSPHYRSLFGTYSGFGNHVQRIYCDQLDKLANQNTCYIQNNRRWLQVSQIYQTLTDQKSFIVYVRCDATGAKSWSVLSTKPKLDEVTVHRIAKHIQALGFDIKKFTTLDFSHCPTTNAIGYSKHAPQHFNHFY